MAYNQAMKPATPDIPPLPDIIPVFPLTGVLLLPRGRLPLHIFEPRYRRMIEACLKTDRLLGIIQPQDNDKLYKVGCVGKIVEFNEMEDGRYMISLLGISRFDVVEEVAMVDGYRRIHAGWDKYHRDREPDRAEIDRERLYKLLENYFSVCGLEADWESIRATSTEKLVHCLAMICPFAPMEKQLFLAAPDLASRAETLYQLLEISAAKCTDTGFMH